jgi:hypothetical protein
MSILEIELTPEMRQRLREKAKRRGLEETAYVQTMVIRDLAQEEPDSERPYSVMDFHGVGRDSWKGVDVQQYLNEMRDEWDKPTTAR